MAAVPVPHPGRDGHRQGCGAARDPHRRRPTGDRGRPRLCHSRRSGADIVEQLTLIAGAARAAVAPALGGALTGWTVDGAPMLRTASAEAIAARDPLGMASFPLVPFSNRIADARFEWAGEHHAIAPNFAPEPHAIHGIGWTSAWEVREARDDRVVLTLDHAGDARWPFAFAAEQIVALTPDTLTVTLTARNLEAFDAPLA
ncbi:MAG: hypothetical protein EOP59_09540, partial [Sphingomonadales bacterium]